MKRNGYFFSILAGLYLAPIILILAAFFDNYDPTGQSVPYFGYWGILFLSSPILFLYGVIVDTILWCRVWRLVNEKSNYSFVALRFIPVFAIYWRFRLIGRIPTALKHLEGINLVSPKLYTWSVVFLALRDVLFWGIITLGCVVKSPGIAETILIGLFLSALAAAACLYAIVVYRIASIVSERS